ncbi:MAG: hypothetical protein LLG37_06735 [Spirochaetia bacterium]|nr:hypothetical protein [Spirochaetia bacterium]
MMMKKISGSRGVTLIELLISSTITAIMIVAAVNLITRVYRDITASQMKTYSMNLVSENLDRMRQNSFEGLAVTDDNLLPDPLSKLESNPDYYESVMIGNQPFKVYRYVQYAYEQNDGNITPSKQSELPPDNKHDLKMITVVVTYMSGGFEKSSRMSTLVSNKQLPLSGSTVSGRVRKLLNDGTVTDPGLGSNASVHFIGYPQYTGRIADDAGNYSISNVAPGSYSLVAKGAGLQDTEYTSNPLTVPDIPTVIPNINITCPAVDCGSVSGNVFWDVIATPTPVVTPSPTPVPFCGITKILGATGSMSGKTSNWNYPTRISVQDNNDSDTDLGFLVNRNNRLLYSQFADYTEANTYICSVTLKYRANCYYGSATVRLHVTNNGGSVWADTAVPSGWTGTVSTVYNSTNIPNMADYLEFSVPLTPLYDSWTWAKVNSLGVAFRSANTSPNFIAWIGMDYAYLEVQYAVATPVPTSTFTPAVTPTPYPSPCADNATIKSLDGLSMPYLTTACYYRVDNIDPSTGETVLEATRRTSDSPPISYYARLTGVPVSAGTVTYQDIFLTVTSDVPTINGRVKDALTGLGLIGAEVYLSDPLDVSPTTVGGGNYTIMPATVGSYILTASLSGYRISEPISLSSIQNGVQYAPDILMYPVGKVSGMITDDVTGDPVSGITVELKNNAGTVLGSGLSNASGIYEIADIPVGSGYKVQPSVDEDEYVITYPIGQYWSNVSVVQGITTFGKDFKIRAKYGTISGTINLTEADSAGGLLILAYPSSVTLVADKYTRTNADQNMQGHTQRLRVTQPYYGSISGQNSSYSIKAPVGATYNIYAYYSSVSITGTVQKPVRTIKKYYKVLSGISPNTSGNNFTGDPSSSWTTY